MKYQNLKSFEKHIASAAPHHLCRVYLIAISDDQERSNAIHHLLKVLLPPGAAPHRFSASDADLRAVLDAVQSPTLFGGDAVVLLEECEKLGKKEAEILSAVLESPNPSGYLLLGARGKTPLAKSVEKVGVVLDMSEEKPWDREKRLAENIAERAKSRGKRLSPDAAPLLFERLGFDVALLDQEIDKLVCYVGERPTIERSDIFRISAASRSHTLWQMAEEIVWAGAVETGAQTFDPAAFHGLIPALRSQLHLGLKIASLSEERVPPEEWSAFLPKMWPRTFEKRKEQAAKKGSAYFRKGLEILFKIELLSRTGSNQPEALLDLFRVGVVAHARR